MKKRKADKSEALIEAVMEIVLTLIALGVGTVVYCLLGIDAGENTNYDGLILVGLIAFFVMLAGVGAIINLTEKKKRGKDGKKIREREDH